MGKTTKFGSTYQKPHTQINTAVRTKELWDAHQDHQDWDQDLDWGWDLYNTVLQDWDVYEMYYWNLYLGMSDEEAYDSAMKSVLPIPEYINFLKKSGQDEKVRNVLREQLEISTTGLTPEARAAAFKYYNL